jgi:hypothetical protein
MTAPFSRRYRVVDKTRVDEIMEIARVAPGRPWSYSYRHHYSHAFPSHLDLKAGSVLKFFHPAIVPGLLQTEAQARAADAATALNQKEEERIEVEIDVRFQHSARFSNTQTLPASWWWSRSTRCTGN